MPLPLAVPIVAGLLGRVFGGASKGSADQRMAENQQRLLQTQAANSDQLARGALMNNNATARASMQNTDAYNRAGLDLQRKQFAQNEPNAQARQALVGNLLSRIAPVQIAGMPQGMGVKSSILDAIGPEARQAGSLLAQRGVSGLQHPTQFNELPPVSLPDVLNLPPMQIAQLQKSGLLEKIMGAIGVGGSVVGALGDMQSVGGNGRTYNPSDENGWG